MYYNTPLADVFIKNCVFYEDFKIFRTLAFSLFFLGVSVCTHARQVEHQRCSRTGRVQKIKKILRKTQYLMNTLYVCWLVASLLVDRSVS